MHDARLMTLRLAQIREPQQQPAPLVKEESSELMKPEVAPKAEQRPMGIDGWRQALQQWLESAYALLDHANGKV